MNSPQSSPKVLETAAAPVQRAIIMVCEKCGQKLVAVGDKSDAVNPALEFQKQMKLEIKERFGKGVVRAVSSSCLDLCPQGRIAVGVANANDGLEFFTVAPEKLSLAKTELLARYNK